jgi:hexosaminidase
MSRLAYRVSARVLTAMICTGWWVAVAASQTSAAVNIIPLPVSIEPRDGSFLITPSTRVVAEGSAATEATKLVEALAPAMGYRLKQVANSTTKDSVQLKVEPPLRERLGEEGYELEATADTVTIRAGAPAGLFYGIQTLRQLLPPTACSKQKVDGVQWSVPCVHITDHPRFAWRGQIGRAHV